jgi:hypothetical protein
MDGFDTIIPYDPYFDPIDEDSKSTLDDLLIPHQQQLHHYNLSRDCISHGIVPPFSDAYISQTLDCSIQSEDDVDVGQVQSYTWNSRRDFANEHHSQSPKINTRPLQIPSPFLGCNNVMSILVTGAAEAVFDTELDISMSVVQAEFLSLQTQAKLSPIEIPRLAELRIRKTNKKKSVSPICSNATSFFS